LRNGWADRWHIADITARYAKGICPICHSRQILASFFSVPAVICQWSPKPLRKVPRIANGLDAEALQNPPDMKTLFNIDWCATLWILAF
jgi:hypothetical protein